MGELKCASKRLGEQTVLPTNQPAIPEADWPDFTMLKPNYCRPTFELLALVIVLPVAVRALYSQGISKC